MENGKCKMRNGRSKMKSVRNFALYTLHFTLVVFAALAAKAATLTLSPGLTPVGGDGAIVEAAALVSTNATATATVMAVYALPVYSPVERVTVVTNDVLTLVTNSVVERVFSPSVTSNFTVNVVYGVATTNYYNVVTNTTVALLPRPGPVVALTNLTVEVTSTVCVTNDLFSLTASGGFAETNNVNRCLLPGARLLLTGSPLTIFLR
jgi:hypothetical protein